MCTHSVRLSPIAEDHDLCAVVNPRLHGETLPATELRLVGLLPVARCGFDSDPPYRSTDPPGLRKPKGLSIVASSELNRHQSRFEMASLTGNASA